MKTDKNPARYGGVISCELPNLDLMKLSTLWLSVANKQLTTPEISKNITVNRKP
ncbi:hypothetical protein QUF61_09430 [Candidatus Venteria ishoeyi]|uniref:hypothetical protein n=1 Tax=Candidatus Venteria ishoeyi TaxID=1899563 RepID=UPI0025A5A260|nr:hypothetical protein [Candidatus Venteria ishoeyi]MDM8546700.1 hypothetical protein [Candidatus Venteria ishoeyi]